VVLILAVTVGLFSAYGVILAAISLVLATVIGLIWRRRRDKQVLARRHAVTRSCQAINSLLKQGLVPNQAITIVGQESPWLAPAAATAQMGGDVAQVLRQISRQPGAGGLAELAWAWQVCQQTGAPLSQAIHRVKENLASQSELADIVAQELSAARATGHLLAGLPLAGLALGYAVGADPLAFLTGHLLGRICLLTGAILACGGAIWSDYLATRAAVSDVEQLTSRPNRQGRSLFFRLHNRLDRQP
jgi:tight adherence protein B